MLYSKLSDIVLDFALKSSSLESDNSVYNSLFFQNVITQKHVKDLN